ncbi:hypothetical protein AB0O91_18740 [Kitasatospora sp. NPDC089797]|uniref:WXG100 family type VII secretion target n=1 Tax=Kitasatospora sp. NPDC089797 TaxID=3155298 RepID=UPI0034271BC1
MVYTDFTKYSHADLRRMAQALDPGAVMAAGDPWRRAATTLKEIRKTLTNASTEAATTWEGTTSDSFHTSMLTLAANINTAAAYANDAADTLHTMSEAMATAKRTMPEEPGTWDQLKDKVGDFFSTEDEHIQLTDRKKAEAAAVMQTLAMHYRIATPALKAPSLNLKPAKRGDPDKNSQDDANGAAAAVAAVVSGASYGTGSTSVRSAMVSPPQRSRSSAPSVVSSPSARNAPTPTDAGIKGGRAQTPLRPSIGASSGSLAGISGMPVTSPGGSVPSPVASGIQTSVLSTTSPVGPASGPNIGGGADLPASPAGSTAQTAPIGPGLGQGKARIGDKDFLGGSTPLDASEPRGGRAGGASGGGAHPGIGAGSRGVSAGKQVGGSLARPGGAIRETAPPGGGSLGQRAFTEGGSGLGARGRLGVESEARGSGMLSPGIPMSEAQRRRRGRGKDGKRPDYLVEDEATWASGKPANPNVVE